MLCKNLIMYEKREKQAYKFCYISTLEICLFLLLGHTHDALGLLLLLLALHLGIIPGGAQVIGSRELNLDWPNAKQAFYHL